MRDLLLGNASVSTFCLCCVAEWSPRDKNTKRGCAQLWLGTVASVGRVEGTGEVSANGESASSLHGHVVCKMMGHPSRGAGDFSGKDLLTTSCQGTRAHWGQKRPWCWGRLRAGGEGGNSGGEGWMSSLTQWSYTCLVTQSCPTLCNPVDCSPSGSSVHGDSPGKNTGVKKKKEYWSRLPCPSPADLPNPGI